MPLNLNNKARGLTTLGSQKQENKRPENVIPMINIVFLLLLYFMIAGNLHLDLEVTPPSSSATNEPPVAVPQIAIQADGSLWLQGQQIQMSQISVELSSIFKEHVVQISADAKTDAVVVAQTIDLLGEAGAKHISLLSLQR